MDPLVSVIIPCYNAGQFIDEAVGSIRNQSYTNLEIILLDDASTDNTYQLLRKHGEGDSRIKVYKNEQNLKLIKTLNKGISLATGEYIARMDADDISCKDRIEKQVVFLKNNPEIDLVSTFAKYITPEGAFHSVNNHFCCTTHHALKFMALFESPFLHAALVGKTSVFKKYQFLDRTETQHIEDYELWTRMFSANIRFHAIPEYLYLYRRNPSSVSFKHQNIQWNNHLLNSRNFLLQELGLEINEDLHKLILTRSDSYSESLSKKVFPAFDDIARRFLSDKNNRLSLLERKEIKDWIGQRKLRIILHYTIKGSVPFRIKAILALFSLIPTLSLSRTLKNIKGKFQWALSEVLK